MPTSIYSIASGFSSSACWRRSRSRFPELSIVVEHITTREAAQFVHVGAGPNVAATITAHHLLLNRNALFVGGVRPASLLPARDQAGNASRGARCGGGERQPEILSRHATARRTRGTPRKPTAAAPASTPRTRRSSCTPKRSTMPARSRSSRISRVATARTSTAAVQQRARSPSRRAAYGCRRSFPSAPTSSCRFAPERSSRGASCECAARQKGKEVTEGNHGVPLFRRAARPEPKASAAPFVVSFELVNIDGPPAAVRPCRTCLMVSCRATCGVRSCRPAICGFSPTVRSCGTRILVRACGARHAPRLPSRFLRVLDALSRHARKPGSRARTRPRRVLPRRRFPRSRERSRGCARNALGARDERACLPSARRDGRSGGEAASARSPSSPTASTRAMPAASTSRTSRARLPSAPARAARTPITSLTRYGTSRARHTRTPTRRAQPRGPGAATAARTPFA